MTYQITHLIKSQSLFVTFQSYYELFKDGMDRKKHH